MNSATKATLISFVALVALAPVALASAPKPADPTIVPGESIGGVSIGQSADEAAKAWGGEGDCKVNGDLRICDYGTNRKGSAFIGINDGEVAFVTLNAGLKGKHYVFRGPLLKFGTEKGDFGLGDKLKKVAKRYPEGKLKSQGHALVFKGDDVRTSFASDADGRIVQISIIETKIP